MVSALQFRQKCLPFTGKFFKKKVQIIYPIPSFDGIFTYMDAWFLWFFSRRQIYHSSHGASEMTSSTPKPPTKLTNETTPVELELGLWKPLGLVRLVRLVHFYCSPPGQVVCGGKTVGSKRSVWRGLRKEAGWGFLVLFHWRKTGCWKFHKLMNFFNSKFKKNA